MHEIYETVLIAAAALFTRQYVAGVVIWLAGVAMFLTLRKKAKENDNSKSDTSGQ